MIRVENDCVLREAVDFSADIGIKLIEDVLIKVALFILLFLPFFPLDISLLSLLFADRGCRHLLASPIPFSSLAVLA